MSQCPKCSSRFERVTDQLCNKCYNDTIFQGQCLNIAAMLLKDNYNPEHKDFCEKLFGLQETIYNFAKNNKKMGLR